MILPLLPLLACFFFNDTATTEIYTLSLHDALPIYSGTGEGWPLSIIELAYLADEEKAGIDKEINAGTVKATDPRITASWQAILDMKNAGCFEKNLATSSYDD